MDQRARELNRRCCAANAGRAAGACPPCPSKFRSNRTNVAHALSDCARNFYDRPSIRRPIFAGPVRTHCAVVAYAEASSSRYGEHSGRHHAAIIRHAQEPVGRTTLITGMGDLTESLAGRLAPPGWTKFFQRRRRQRPDAPRRPRLRGSPICASGARAWPRGGDAIASRHATPQHLGRIADIVELAASAVQNRCRISSKLYTRPSRGQRARRAGRARRVARARSVAAAHSCAWNCRPRRGRACEQPYGCSFSQQRRCPGLLLGAVRIAGSRSAARTTARDNRSICGMPRRCLRPAPSCSAGVAARPCANCAFRIFTPEAHRRFLHGSPMS